MNRSPSKIVCLATGLLLCSVARAADTWTDISSSLMARLTNNAVKAPWPGGASGVIVNRTNGEVTIKVVGFGLWRSSDKGRNWRRVDNNTISGRDETGWATSVDQNSPGRIASFSLDGSAGWTANGTDWKAFTNLGRNWDYGSVDWATPIPKTIIAAKHETTPPGEVYVTEDGGVTWKKLAIHLQEKRDRVSMVGALAATILIYGNGDGIHRSTDTGITWTKVSPANPQTRIPILFHGAHYLGSTNGLLVSRDLGASWQQQGSPANIWLGPFFGSDESEMMVVGANGIYPPLDPGGTGIFITRNAGATWRLAANPKSKETGFPFTPNWFGCYAWDPVNNAIYASAMGNPVYRLDL